VRGKDIHVKSARLSRGVLTCGLATLLLTVAACQTAQRAATPVTLDRFPITWGVVLSQKNGQSDFVVIEITDEPGTSCMEIDGTPPRRVRVVETSNPGYSRDWAAWMQPGKVTVDLGSVCDGYTLLVGSLSPTGAEGVIRTEGMSGGGQVGKFRARALSAGRQLSP